MDEETWRMDSMLDREERGGLVPNRTRRPGGLYGAVPLLLRFLTVACVIDRGNIILQRMVCLRLRAWVTSHKVPWRTLQTRGPATTGHTDAHR
jgi:hypothetical protein